MECPTKLVLLAYLDGELAEDERAAVAVHLMTCTGCSQWLERLQDLQERVRRHVLKEMGLSDLDPGESPPPETQGT